eukprot:3940368-Rhodomonas_salina.5
MEAEDMLENAAAKDNQYRAVADFLRRHCRGYQISHQSYIMSVYCIIDQPSWEKHLTPQCTVVVQKGIGRGNWYKCAPYRSVPEHSEGILEMRGILRSTSVEPITQLVCLPIVVPSGDNVLFATVGRRTVVLNFCEIQYNISPKFACTGVLCIVGASHGGTSWQTLYICYEPPLLVDADRLRPNLVQHFAEVRRYWCVVYSRG